VQNILLVWGAILGLSIAIIATYHKRHGLSPYYRSTSKHKARVKQAADQMIQGVKFVKQSDLLRSLSIALFFMVITFYVLCYSVNRVYTNTFQTEETLTSFYGVLTAFNSTLALAMQIFLTNRVLRKFGVKRTNMFFPLSTAFSYIGLMFSFTLPSALIGSFNKDAIMPAFRNPVRNMFFNALPNYMQGRARAMSIALVLPLALATTGGLLLLAQMVENIMIILAIGATSTVAYLFYSMRINRAYMKSLLSSLQEKVFLPVKDIGIDPNESQLIDELAERAAHEDDEICYAYSKRLIEIAPERAAEVVLPRLKNADHKLISRIIPLLRSIKNAEMDAFLYDRLNMIDDHLKAIAMMILIDNRHPKAGDRVENFIKSDNPRLKCVAIYGIDRLELDGYKPQAREMLDGMLTSRIEGETVAALELLGNIQDTQHRPQVVALLQSDNERILISALQTLAGWDIGESENISQQLSSLYKYSNPEIRKLTMRCIRFLPEQEREQLAMLAIEDDHADVRRSAINTLFKAKNKSIEDIGRWIIDNQTSPRTQMIMLEILISKHPSKEVLEHIATAKTEDAHLISMAKDLMEDEMPQSPGSGLKLIQHILNERQQQYIELILMALEHLEDPMLIRTIRAGLNSGDARSIANAGEALRNINNEKLARSIGDLLEDVGHTHENKKHMHEHFHSPRDVLTWCSQRADPWMSSSANYAIETIGG